MPNSHLTPSNLGMSCFVMVLTPSWRSRNSKCSVRLSIGSCHFIRCDDPSCTKAKTPKPRHHPRHINWFTTEHDLGLRVDDVTSMIGGSGPVHLKQVHEDDQSSLPSCIHSFVECGRMQEPHFHETSRFMIIQEKFTDKKKIARFSLDCLV